MKSNYKITSIIFVVLLLYIPFIQMISYEDKKYVCEEFNLIVINKVNDSFNKVSDNFSLKTQNQS